jgi:hypothetical protein
MKVGLVKSVIEIDKQSARTTRRLGPNSRILSIGPARLILIAYPCELDTIDDVEKRLKRRINFSRKVNL